ATQAHITAIGTVITLGQSTPTAARPVSATPTLARLLASAGPSSPRLVIAGPTALPPPMARAAIRPALPSEPLAPIHRRGRLAAGRIRFFALRTLSVAWPGSYRRLLLRTCAA